MVLRFFGMSKDNSFSGFSLIELIIVLSITLFISTLSLPLLEIIEVKTREKNLRDDLRDVRSAIDRYRAESRDPITPYPPCVASLLEPIPSSILRPGGMPGPFLSKLPKHSFTSGEPVFLWDLRDAKATDSSSWHSSVNDPKQVFASGIIDIRVPLNDMGNWVEAVDGSKYANW